MNRLSLVTTNPWSRRRWVATALGILGLQITAILLLDRQKLRTASATHFGPGVQFAMDAASTKRWIESPLSLDPTVFGLPHSDGFSGTAWLDAQSMEYQAKEWTEPPRWLEPSPQYFGSFFASFVAEEKPGVLRIADKSIPALNASDVWISSDAIAATTDLQAEGAAARRLIRPETNSLPSWPHSDILSNTVVQIVIDAAGIPVSTTLLAGSGLASADQYGLKAANEAHFQPLGKIELNVHPNRLDWGRMIFRWHTLPLTETNGPNRNL